MQVQLILMFQDSFILLVVFVENVRCVGPIASKVQGCLDYVYENHTVHSCSHPEHFDFDSICRSLLFLIIILYPFQRIPSHLAKYGRSVTT